MSASFPRQKFHSPSRFPSPFSVLFLRAKRVPSGEEQGEHSWLYSQAISKFAKRAARYNEFGIIKETSLAHPFRWSWNWQAHIWVRRSRANSGTAKRDFVHVYTFLSLASIVLSNCNASYCGIFYLLPVVSVWGKLEEIYIYSILRFFRTTQFFTSILNTRYIWLIYVTDTLLPASERRLRQKDCQNGGKFERFKNILKKSHSIQIVKD